VVFTPSILTAKDEESVEIVAYTLCIEAASEEEFSKIVVDMLFKLEEKDAELAVIAAANEEDVVVIEFLIDPITSAAEAELLFILTYAPEIFCPIDWDII